MSKYPLLEKVNYPEELRKLPPEKLPQLCQELREYLIDTLADVGGHFSSNLGVVELTVAIHYAYDTPNDRLVWDVGHQVYPHKILTGRRERLKSVRKLGGLSGFPKRDESKYDHYNTGHAGTSISQCLGEAVARDILKQSYKSVCVIGDASAASGMAFEALNHGGHIKTDCTVILNDNDMSISHNVGALNSYLNRLITSPLYNRWRKFWLSFLMWMPIVGPMLQLFAKKLEKSFKDFLTPGSLFEDFGFSYIGPVDGHDIQGLVQVLKRTREMKGPLLVHVYTQKGRGYQPAEENPIEYHHVNTFNRENGKIGLSQAASESISFSQIVGDTLLELAQEDEKLAIITPAMIEGSGLRRLYDKIPDRVYDVGIAEQHSMTFAGAMAAGGVNPFLCIYSTFLNRAYDQLIQDVSLMNLPVKIVIDRAGCVGPDGETHQGLFDLGMLLSTPNIQIYTPTNGLELKAILKHMAAVNDSAIAVRFPKASTPRSELENSPLPDISSTQPLVEGEGDEMAIVTVGTMYQIGRDVAAELMNRGDVGARVISLRWIRPLDFKFLGETLRQCKRFIIIEDSYEYCGAATYIRANLDSEINGQHLATYAFPTRPILHGTRSEIFNHYGLSPSAIVENVMTILNVREKQSQPTSASAQL